MKSKQTVGVDQQENVMSGLLAHPLRRRWPKVWLVLGLWATLWALAPTLGVSDELIGLPPPDIQDQGGGWDPLSGGRCVHRYSLVDSCILVHEVR